MGLGMLGCGANCAKMLLFFFNFIFWLGGVAMIALGVWFLVDTSSLSYVVSFISVFDDLGSEDSGLKFTAYLFIGVGAFVFIVGFCGCCGAIKKNRCLLGLYVFFIFIVIGAQIAGGVLAFLYRNEVEDNVKKIGSTYVNETYMNDKAADYGLNWIQWEYKCCGVNGVGDYKNSSYGQSSSGGTVSPYCCAMTSGYKFDKRNPEPMDRSACETSAWMCQNGACPTPPGVYTKGCLQSILDWMNDNLPIFIGVGLGIAGLEIFGIILGICLCRQIGKGK